MIQKKIIKILFSFLAGVVAGVVGVFLYEVFGKPALPKVEKHNVTFSFEIDDDIKWIDETIKWLAPETLEDTQPILVSKRPEYDGPDKYLSITYHGL
jgi:hypothetical protein